MPPTPDNFFGREKELATLRQLWDQVTAKDANSAYGGPRMAMILAETGYGKTRLIQALYQQLTNDPLWDPAEVNYWPDAFQEVSNQLRVNPDMTKHSPKGPPRFLWAGMRWYPPEERNLEERTCSLPEIRDVLRTHVEISRQHSDVWTKLKAKAGKAIKTDGISEATGQIVDFLGIPFGGLLLKGAKAIGNLATAKSSRSFEEESEKKATDITEELLGDFREIFGAMGSGGVVLPTILFLDDAQWIDPITFKFIGQQWREAESKKWPLFVVITHWERNWRELLKKPENEHESSLAYFKEKKGVHFIELGPSSNNELERYLKQKLTGLTEEQRKLLLDKSGGNFLTLVENVGFLLQTKMNFENGNVQGKLSKGGENKVKTWEEERQKRIEQMFAGLSDETKNLLGWSGQLGIRFIKNVVIDFASKQGLEIELNRLIDECIDPLVILGKASENIREFRHRAFYHVASQYFRDYLSDSEGLLKSTLQKHLFQWVNNSFTSEGGLVEIDENDENQIINAAICLEQSERRDLLEIAVREFMPVTGQAKDLDIWIRSVYLLVKIDSEDNLWDLVREKGNFLKEVDWNELSNSVLDLELRIDLSENLETSGAIRIAKRIRQNVLHQQKLLNEQLNTLESLGNVALSLLSIGKIEQAEGNLQISRTLFSEGLEIRKKQAEQLNTPDSLRGVSAFLLKIGEIELEEYNLECAKTLFSECLDISRKLANQLNTPRSMRDLSVSLQRIGDIELEEGDLDTAEALYSECLEISRKQAEQLNTPESLRDVSCSLQKIGDIEVAKRNLEFARTLHSECLAIIRKLADQMNTPESLRDLSFSLERIGEIEKEEDNLSGAKILFAEVLEIRRKLADQMNTPESLRDLSFSLERIGEIEKEEDNLGSAKIFFAECLDINRKLAMYLNTPGSLRDLSFSLEIIGDIEKAENNLDTAKALYFESLEIRRKLAEQIKTADSLHDVSFSLNIIGGIEVVEGNLECAKSFFSESLEISRKLAQQLNIPVNINQKIWSLQLLAHVQFLLEENQLAFNLLKESESNVDELQSECTGAMDFLDTLATYWERRTAVEEKLKMPEAKTSKAKAEDIRNEIENKRAK
jgi:tetratricopeptide (TPR) repeat protein